MSPALLLLAAVVLLEVGLQFGGPTLPYWLPLVFLVPSFGCMLAAFAAERKTQAHEPVSARWLAVALCILLAITFKEYPGMYVKDAAYNARAMAWTGIFLAYAIFRVWADGRYEKAQRYGFWIAIGGFLFLRAGMIFASPEPYIDVYSMITQGTANLLQGRNPFVYPINDIYNGSMGWCYTMNAYSYTPSNLIPHALAQWLTGDIRAATVVTDMIGALLLLDIGRRTLDRGRGELLALLYLAQPRSLFVLEQGWTEPLLSFVFIFFVWLWTRGYKKTALAAYGYLLSLKQYLVFTALHVLILERRWKRLWIIALTGIATTMPFLIWNAPAVIREGFLMQLSTCFRPNTPSLASLFHAASGIVPGKLWTIALGIGSAAFFPWWLKTLPPLRRYAYCALGSLFSLFVLGSQGILNYYTLVATLLILTLCLPQSEERV